MTDISAYRRLRAVHVSRIEFDAQGNPEDTYSYVDGRIIQKAAKTTPEMVKGLKAADWYTWEDHMRLVNSPVDMDAFRNELAQMVGFVNLGEAWADEKQEYAFAEFINLIDDGAVIGPMVAKKLHTDWTHYDRAASKLGEGVYKPYRQWQLALEFAADYGVVVFR